MNNYSIITYATVTTEYIVKAKNEKEEEEKFYGGEYIDSNILDYHDETVDNIAVDEENVKEENEDE